MPTGDVDRFGRVGSHLATDFINTVVDMNDPAGSLRSAKDVTAFLAATEALDPAHEAEAKRALRDESVGEKFFRRTLALREVVRRVLERIAAAKPVADDDLAALNDVLRADGGYETIEPAPGRRYALGFHRTRTDVTHLLAPIARSVGELLAAEAPPVRKCANPECIRFFYDASRTGKRRWCDMAICGNRAKAAAFQARKRSAEA